MNGKIGFTSFEGKGTIFWVTLPLAAAGEYPQQPQEQLNQS
jgi:signal transduction histidine kinase